jgi:thiol-disulfide isomerase/thioredoxin
LDLESAKQAARQVNRPILVHFWSPSCVPCVKLEQEVYSRPEVQRAMESMFVLARLNVDDYPATASNFGVKSWPADVILAPDGQFVTLLKCPLVASQYLAQLSQFGRTASPVTAGAPMRPELAQNGAASGPSSVPPVNAFGAAAANPVLQTSALASQPAAPMGAQSNSPYQWSNSADRIERYDFTAAQRTQGPSPPPQVGGQQPASPAGGEQSFSQNYQTAAAQTYDMVPALAAPSVGLDGYCPVQLQRVRQFNRDDPRY